MRWGDNNCVWWRGNSPVIYVSLLVQLCLGLLCFAGPNALVPRVSEVCVLGTSAVSKPRTTTAAAAASAGFLNSTAFGTYRIDIRCSDCCCWHVKNGQINKMLQQPKPRTNQLSASTRQPWTYLCRPPRPQASCDQIFCRRHLRSSCTKHHQERNN